MLQNLKFVFDDDDIIKRNNVYNKFFNVDFFMKNNEIFIAFFVRYINTMTRLKFFNYDLLFHFERNFTRRLRKNVIVFFTFIKNYYIFVQQVKTMNSRYRTLNQIRSSESNYSKSNSLTKKKKNISIISKIAINVINQNIRRMTKTFRANVFHEC